MATETFGDFAHKLRRKQGLGLRQAARLMGVSPAYLSQVEKGTDDPAQRLIAAMSQLYKCPLAEIRAAVERAGVRHRKPPNAMRTIEELRALYRLGGMFTTDEVEGMMRHMLSSRGLTDEEIENQLAKFRAELPRIRGGDGLFASEIKPRILSKRRIAEMAYHILAKNGLGQANYEPPTPIEQIVESEEGISYTIAQLPSTNRDPVVLGRSRWNGDEREITINNDLANSDDESHEHRFRFTLGHEFFHAIEHLPLATSSCGNLPRAALQGIGFVDVAATGAKMRSRAERAVERWAQAETSRGLVTREDWREWQANTFASAILMPEWAVRRAFEERVGTEYVCVPKGTNQRQAALEVAGEFIFADRVYGQSLGQLFDVSRQAMAIRLLDLGLVQEVSG